MTTHVQNADRVFAHLRDFGPKDAHTIMADLGISYYEFAKAKEIIRDTISDMEHAPFSYDAHTNLYSVTGTEVERMAYTARRLQSNLTQIGRVLSGTIDPCADVYGPTSVWPMIQHAVGQVESSVKFANEMVKAHIP